MGFTGVRGPNGYGFSDILVINRTLILPGYFGLK